MRHATSVRATHVLTKKKGRADWHLATLTKCISANSSKALCQIGGDHV